MLHNGKELFIRGVFNGGSPALRGRAAAAFTTHSAAPPASASCANCATGLSAYAASFPTDV
jgi:hypothetical protein